MHPRYYPECKEPKERSYYEQMLWTGVTVFFATLLLSPIGA